MLFKILEVPVLSYFALRCVKICHVALRSAVFTGRSYGDGIYLSTAFEKSFGYSSGFDQGSLYLLLCDVSPGRSKKLLQWEPTTDFSPKFDSLVSVGRNGPSPAGQVRLTDSGLLVPAGKIETRDKYFNYDFDEVVVYNQDRVSIRYIVRLSGSGSSGSSPTIFGNRGPRIVQTAKRRIFWSPLRVAEVESWKLMHWHLWCFKLLLIIFTRVCCIFLS